MAKQRKCGQAAKVAAKLLFDGAETEPLGAWQRAVAEIFPDSSSSRDKPCPRSSFLALCELGAIKNVRERVYTRSVDNKRYMDLALRALIKEPRLLGDEDQLWQIATSPKVIKPNNQIEVLTTLWQEGFVLNPF